MAKPCVLVVGGAGYIGSHINKELHRRGCPTVVLDNLVYGHRSAVKWGEFVHGDMADAHLVQYILRHYQVEAVMHFAAFAYVGESVKDPAKYYRNNVAGTLSLLESMRIAGVSKLIFSSTCATYGVPETVPIPEEHPQKPVNPYGWSKLMVEQMLADYNKAYGMQYVPLRYFNAAGADPEGEIGEDHDPETHLIPLVLDAALGRRPHIEVFGTDYPTPDGTCIRDYIHVADLANAHVIALEYLSAGNASTAFNLGNGGGYSVYEVIDCVRRVTNQDVPVVNGPRRPGDPPELVAKADKARALLGWTPQYPDIEDIVRHAHQWHS